MKGVAQSTRPGPDQVPTTVAYVDQMLEMHVYNSARVWTEALVCSMEAGLITDSGQISSIFRSRAQTRFAMATERRGDTSLRNMKSILNDANTACKHNSCDAKCWDILADIHHALHDWDQTRRCRKRALGIEWSNKRALLAKTSPSNTQTAAYEEALRQLGAVSLIKELVEVREPGVRVVFRVESRDPAAPSFLEKLAFLSSHKSVRHHRVCRFY